MTTEGARRPSEWPVMAGLTLAAALYGIGWQRLVQRRRRRPVQRRPMLLRVCAYGAGLTSIGVALLSPLDELADMLFSAHMAEHLLLLMVAPPLIWLGAPLVPTLWAFPRRVRRAIGRALASRSPLHRLLHVLTNPFVALPLYLATVALWHVPRFYDAAQGRTLLHDLEHLLFLGAGLLYWWPIVHPTGGRRRLALPMILPYLLPAFLLNVILGAMLTFAGQPLYHTYQAAAPTSSLSIVEDQQLGGLIMWIPGGMMYLIPLAVVIGILLREESAAGAERRL